jgi:hypothetical protein
VPASFEICIENASYPKNCKPVVFQTLGSSGATQQVTWTNLVPGSYTVTETTPSGGPWQVTISGSPALVTLGGSGSATVENRYAPASCSTTGNQPGIEYEVGAGGPLDPQAECAAYGLTDVCVASPEIGGIDTCGGTLGYYPDSNAGGPATTVLFVPSASRLVLLKAGAFLVGYDVALVPATFPNPGPGTTQEPLDHVTVCRCPTP